MIDRVTEIVLDALLDIVHWRYFDTERGFQGEFQARLSAAIPILPSLEAIVEQENQKRMSVHGIRRRPDVIIHVPTCNGEDRRQSNLAVFEIKRAAGPSKARQDFHKLDTVMAALDYQFGAFINIASKHTRAAAYSGIFPERMHWFAVWRENRRTYVTHACYKGSGLVECTYRSANKTADRP